MWNEYYATEDLFLSWKIKRALFHQESGFYNELQTFQNLAQGIPQRDRCQISFLILSKFRWIN